MFNIKLLQHIREDESPNIKDTELMVSCAKYQVLSFDNGEKDLLLYRSLDSIVAEISLRLDNGEVTLPYPTYFCAFVMNESGATIDKVMLSESIQNKAKKLSDELQEAITEPLSYKESTDAMALIKEFLGYGATESHFCKLDKNKIGYILYDSKASLVDLDHAMQELSPSIQIKYQTWSYDKAAALFTCSNRSRLKFLHVDDADKMIGPETMWIRRLTV